MDIALKFGNRQSRIITVILLLIISFANLSNFSPVFSQDLGKNNSTCNCVVFRFDDIQDRFLNKSQLAVMDLFLHKNQTLSLALISNHLGNDSSIINKVRSGYETGNLELDSHGWNHENFTKLDGRAQLELLREANQKIYELFGTRPVVFIPPSFDFDNSTLQAMTKTDMRIISSYTRFYDQRNESFLITSLNNSDAGRSDKIVHLPSTLEYSFFENMKWIERPTSDVLDDIDRSISKYGYAVVNTHPQEFANLQDGNIINSVNMTKINNLAHLLDSLASSKIKITDFYTLSKIL